MNSPLLPLPIDAFRDATGLAVFGSADDVVATLAPDDPVQCIFPERLRGNARAFLATFPGKVLYAVKCNPDRRVLQYLYRAGVRHFDVASEGEIALIHGLFPSARMSFMHPVKSRRAIQAAFRAGIRDFAIDSESELVKIIEEGQTGAAQKITGRINFFVRLALPKGDAAYDLSGKFGIAGDEAVALLRSARRVAGKLGVCFHVGSQCMSPDAYVQAIARARDLIDRAGVRIDVLDVGGGFPIAYPDLTPPPLQNYMDAIQASAKAQFPGVELWCEPGRAMVGTGGSVIVKVELRRGDKLYINDGTYGSLFDAGSLGWRFPVRIIRPEGETSQTLTAFSFYGPTCDSVDFMKGPFLLPDDIREGDWIEITQLGSYGAAMRTAFNGFYSDTAVAIVPPRGYSAEARKDAKTIHLHGNFPARRAARNGVRKNVERATHKQQG